MKQEKLKSVSLPEESDATKDLIKCILMLSGSNLCFHLPKGQTKEEVIRCFGDSKVKNQLFAFQFHEGPIVLDNHIIVGLFFENK